MALADNIDRITKFLKWIKWGHIGKATVVLMLIGLTTAVWENRPKIYERMTLNVGRVGLSEIPLPSAKTVDNIKIVVDGNDTIVAAQLVNLDWKRNEKHPVYFYSDKNELKIAMAIYMAERLSSSPLLVSGDVENNERLIKIINGEFVCIPIPPRFVRSVPAAGKNAKVVCSISVPPYFGKIVGYVNLWIDHFPTDAEIPDYRATARTLSVDVYERDINPSTKL